MTYTFKSPSLAGLTLSDAWALPSRWFAWKGNVIDPKKSNFGPLFASNGRISTTWTESRNLDTGWAPSHTMARSLIEGQIISLGGNVSLALKEIDAWNNFVGLWNPALHPLTASEFSQLMAAWKAGKKPKAIVNDPGRLALNRAVDVIWTGFLTSRGYPRTLDVTQLALADIRQLRSAWGRTIYTYFGGWR